jgi:hypothetical protein
MQIQTLKFVKKEVPYWATDSVPTPAGTVYTVSTEWARADYWGMIRSRTGAYRMNYAVTPGLYAVPQRIPMCSSPPITNLHSTFSVVH